jgi:hypothetical protein
VPANTLLETVRASETETEGLSKTPGQFEVNAGKPTLVVMESVDISPASTSETRIDVSSSRPITLDTNDLVSSDLLLSLPNELLEQICLEAHPVDAVKCRRVST